MKESECSAGTDGRFCGREMFKCPNKRGLFTSEIIPVKNQEIDNFVHGFDDKTRSKSNEVSNDSDVNSNEGDDEEDRDAKSVMSKLKPKDYTDYENSFDEEEVCFSNKYEIFKVGLAEKKSDKKFSRSIKIDLVKCLNAENSLDLMDLLERFIHAFNFHSFLHYNIFKLFTTVLMTLINLSQISFITLLHSKPVIVSEYKGTLILVTWILFYFPCLLLTLPLIILFNVLTTQVIFKILIRFWTL